MNKEIFVKKVEEIKEVLSNMPQNNKSNKVKYIEYVDSQVKIYNNFKNDLVNEIKRRFDDISAREKIDISKIADLNKEKEILFNDLLVIESNNSSYEKIGLDKYIFNINKYYEDNINSLNKEIRNVIKCFFDVGIKLSIDDFYYSYYLKDYMSVLLNNEEDSKVKEKFDQIYWKCPNIVNQISMNFASLYYKNEKIFDEYFVKRKNEILSNNTEIELITKYNHILDSIKEDYYSIENISKRFIDGEDNVRDFSMEKYKTYEESICNGEADNNSFEKLNDTLYEYSVYLKYKYIVDEIINIYKEKDKHKNTFKNLRNEILKEEKKILKINKKIEFQNKWKKDSNKIEILNIELNGVIDGLKEKYDNLELVKINDKLSGCSNNLSYYDIFKIVATHYIYLRSILVKNDETIEDNTVDEIQLELLNFLLNNKLNILDNVFVLDSANLSNIISNKYKLSNIKIDENDIDSNVDNYIELLRKIKIVNSINGSNVGYEEMLFQVDSLPILNK